ncbi:MAG: hypothetical protein HeimC3_03640 [Candidatus Heimdallarchaeota archaeon LC_3]|nr:MAG: hypothetical protein HeimC3_03640 [Candidatus Heimdallarchaeota archaeon LC_3]
MADNKIKTSLEFSTEILGKIEILCEEELYLDPKAFIEKAIQNELSLHDTTIKSIIKEYASRFGILHLNAKDLETYIAKGQKVKFKFVGLLSFASDITPELVEKAIDKINLAGALKANENLLPFLQEKRYSLLRNRKYSSKMLKE